jgi:hypothetical protein
LGQGHPLRIRVIDIVQISSFAKLPWVLNASFNPPVRLLINEARAEYEFKAPSFKELPGLDAILL